MSEAFTFLDPGSLIDGDLELVLVGRYPADPAKAHVPGYEFEIRRRPDHVLAGHIRLRIGDMAGLLKYASHVGYDVNPESRGRHYAARSVRLLLPFARAHGLTKLWISCQPANLASRRTCELAGAVLRDTVEIPEGHEMYAQGWRQACRYSIEL